MEYPIYERKNKLPELKAYERHTAEYAILYNQKTCPHCIRFLPEVNKAVKEAEIPFFRVDFERGETANFMVHTQKVPGFPSLRKYSKGGKQIAEFRGKRTAEEVIRFLKSSSA